jgi:hypothetical protein
VDGINRRRDQVLTDHVPFLAYHRPRVGVALVEPPVRSLDPGLAAAPVPACLAHPAAVPAELRAMTELFREAPVQWFTQVAPLLDRLDRLDVLYNALQAAKLRAGSRTLLGSLTEQDFGGGTLGPALFNVFAAQRQVITPLRLQTAQLDLSTLLGGTWRLWRDRAGAVVSLGDLIDGGHGRADVAQQAARELNNIMAVAGCLYAQLGTVLPRIRLDWAERLGPYDAPVNLRNLTVLPRWGEIASAQRREMQGDVDWLFQRVDAGQAGAFGLMNDLVRICILLASHAPVSQILAGHVIRPTIVGVGGRVDLVVDHTRVRVGMDVMLYAQNEVVARGVVEDVGTGAATARVVYASRPSVALEADARVHLAESDGFVQGPLMNGFGL